MSYGPQLPSWLTKHQEKNDEELEKEDHEEDEEVAYGPMIPKSAKPSESPKNSEEDPEDVPNSYGPSIPSHFLAKAGPQLPEDVDDDSDDEIGPMPVSAGNEEKEALERAYRMVMQKEAEHEEKNAQPKREEWMTTVPKKLGNFGLGARTFKKGAQSERDSTWEDAPGAKKKRAEERSVKAAGVAAADARQAALVAEKTAGPSLLEIHQQKREEKANSANYQPGERRPFDREKDMEVRGLKPGGSKDAVDRMKELTGRFANSKDQRFL